MRLLKLLCLAGLALFAGCEDMSEKPLRKDSLGDYISMSEFEALPQGVCTGTAPDALPAADTQAEIMDGKLFPQIGPTLNHDDLLIFNIYISPNQRCLISKASRSGHPRVSSLRLWDLKTGQAIGGAMPHGPHIYGAAFNKDRSRVLSWGEDGYIRQWDSRSALPLERAMNHGGLVRGARYNKDETRILSHSTWDASTRLWDAQTGQQIGRTMKQNSYVTGANYNQDETKILSWTWGDARLWDADTGKRLRQLKKDADNSSSLGQALFVNDDKEIILAAGTRLKFIDAETGRKLPSRIKLSGSLIGHLELLPGERTLLITQYNLGGFSQAHKFDVESGDRIGKVLGQIYPTTGSQISADQSKFLAGLQNGKAVLRDFETGELVIPEMVHHENSLDNPYVYVKFSPNEKLIATSTLTSKPSVTKLWNAATGEQIGETLPGEGKFTANGQHLVTHDDKGNIRLWDISRAYSE